MKSSNFINESVFRVNLKYAKAQNETKELFFKCLDEGKDEDYFNEQVEKIWDNIDRSYMDKEIVQYQEIIHEKNVEGRKKTELIPLGAAGILFALVPKSKTKAVDNKFVKMKEREYKVSLNSPVYKSNKEEYLKIKVDKYTNQIVPYYSHETNKIIRYVQPSTYNSMIHNTNLTRSGWNQTLNDADEMGVNLFWIPYHPFSCSYCLEHQNRVMTKSEITRMIGIAEEAEGDILHPNCKCTIAFYDNSTKFNRPDYSNGELDEQYHIRQKVNSLTLKKEEVLTDMKIQKSLGNQDEVDKLNQQRNKINSQIRELKDGLPTTSLKKQVVAINR